jgi:hypothetical protein
MRRVLIALAVASWAGITVAAQSTQTPSTPTAGSPAGPAAYTCGNPTNPPQISGRGAQPIFPPGQFRVSLPAISLLGARNDLPNPYEAGVDWGQLPAGRKWGSTASVTTAADGTIWVTDRCGNSGAGGATCAGASAAVDPIFQFEPSGKLVKSFGAGIFVSPHKLTLDDGGNLWMADNGGHQVFKMTRDGRVLLTLGKKGIAGSGNDEFDAPTEVAIAPNGDIFVADGHTGGGTAVGNARIVKFDKTGKFIKAWGKKGMGLGEFDVPHTLAFDSRGRLFVGDRHNNRIQIFDQNGTFLDEWTQFGRPSGIAITSDDTIYVADSESWGPDEPGWKKGIRIGSAKDGSVKYFIEDIESTTQDHSGAEGVGVDRDGNVYGSVVRRMMLEKHSLRK